MVCGASSKSGQGGSDNESSGVGGIIKGHGGSSNSRVAVEMTQFLIPEPSGIKSENNNKLSIPAVY